MRTLLASLFLLALGSANDYSAARDADELEAIAVRVAVDHVDTRTPAEQVDALLGALRD